MQTNKLVEGYCVRGQLTPAEIAAAKDAGFTTIICNRPDGEKAGQPSAAEVAAAAAGLAFHANPVEPGNFTPEAVRRQAEIIASAEGPVLAYCGSGQRAAVLWMLANPHGLSADERIACAGAAGFDLGALRPRL